MSVGNINDVSVRNEFRRHARIWKRHESQLSKVVDSSGVKTVLWGADPTATIGLAAVNGSASTFIRSDGAPALSQAIVPTWTGAHTFSSTVTMNGLLDLNASVTGVNSLLLADATGDTIAPLVFVNDYGPGEQAPRTMLGVFVNTSTGNLRATRHGGIVESNLVDKSDTEAITGAWTFRTAATLGDTGAASTTNIAGSSHTFMIGTSGTIGLNFRDNGSYTGAMINFLSDAGVTQAAIDNTGVFYKGSVAGGDNYIYESLATVVPTGAWNPSGNWTPSAGTWDFSSATVTGLPAGSDTIEDILSNGATASTEPIFGGGASFLDSDIATFGTGDDLQIYHDGTNSYLSGIQAEGATSGLNVTRLLWDCDTDYTSLDYDAANRPGNQFNAGSAQAFLVMGHTDSGGTWNPVIGFYPYARYTSEIGEGPGIIFEEDNWFIGDRHGGSNSYSGFGFRGSSLDFVIDNTKVLSATTSGLQVEGGSVARIQSIHGQRMEILPRFTSSSPPDSNKSQLMFASDGTAWGASVPGASSPFMSIEPQVNATGEYLGHFWHSNAALSLPGFGLVEGNVLTFDDTSRATTMAQGNTYMRYTGGELLTFVDAAECIALAESSGAQVAFYGSAPVSQQTISSARDNPEGALADLLTALDALGLIVDSSTAS